MALVDSVKEYNGDVKIFSSLHISGEREYTRVWTYVGGAALIDTLIIRYLSTGICEFRTC